MRAIEITTHIIRAKKGSASASYSESHAVDGDERCRHIERETNQLDWNEFTDGVDRYIIGR